MMRTNTSRLFLASLAGVLTFAVGGLAQAGRRSSPPSASCGTAPSRAFYAIAHMTNTPAAVAWAMKEGANAVEVDLQFTSTGTPKSFRHSAKWTEACDCTCNFVPSSRHVCKPLGVSCSAQSTATTLLTTLAKQRKLALVIIDSKITGAQSVTVQKRAGGQVVAYLDKYLFGRGYRGKAIVGVGSTETLAYLEGAAKRASTSRYKSRIHFTIDMEGKKSSDAGCTIQTLAGLSRNRVYGTGVSACAAGNFEAAISTAASNRARGVVGLAYVWTLDKKSSMRTYINKGATGIITNMPRDLVAVLREKGIPLATPTTPLPAATSDQVIGASSCGCDCNYHPGGCVISRPAPPGLACKCSYKGAWTCGGSNVRCKNQSSPLCRRPDTSVAACVQGGGDCDGYKAATCDCNYERGGCYISRAAPKGTACKCKYKGAWTCGGSVVRCRTPSSRYCTRPDRSVYSCRLGGGDCKAKRYK